MYQIGSTFATVCEQIDKVNPEKFRASVFNSHSVLEFRGQIDMVPMPHSHKIRRRQILHILELAMLEKWTIVCKLS